MTGDDICIDVVRLLRCIREAQLRELRAEQARLDNNGTSYLWNQFEKEFNRG